MSKPNAVVTQSHFPVEPPHNLDAELAVLGAMLLGEEAIDKLIHFLRPSDFYLEQHQNTYQAILNLWRQELPVDQITLADQMERDGTLKKAGGRQFVVSLTDKVATSSNVEYHARIIKEESFRRSMISFSDRCRELASDRSQDIFETFRQSNEALDHVQTEISQLSGNGAYNLAHDALITMERKSEAAKKTGYSGIPIGIHELDQMTGGIQSDDYILIVGNSGKGKTAFLINLILGALINNRSVGHIDLEMQRATLGQRMMSALSHVNYDRIRKHPHLQTSIEKSRIMRAYNWLAKQKLYTRNRYLQQEIANISAIEQEIKQLARVERIDFLALDSINLIKAHRANKMQEHMEAASTGLRNASLQAGIPLVVTAQMNDEQGKRMGYEARPRKEDIRYSRQPYYDCSLVLGFWEPYAAGIEYDPSGNSIVPLRDESMQETDKVVVLSVVKGRDGNEGRDVWMHFDMRRQRMTPWSGSFNFPPSALPELFPQNELSEKYQLGEPQKISFEPGNADFEPESEMLDESDSRYVPF